MFNGDVLTHVDLGAVLAAAPRAQGQGDDRADAGRQSAAYGLVETDARRQHPAVPREAQARTRSPATPSTRASTCSSPTPSTASRRTPPWSIERSFFPSLIERGETFVAYVYRGYWIDIGTPEKYLQVHRDIMDGRFRAAVRRRGTGVAWVVAGGASRGGRELQGPCFVDEGRSCKAGARIGPTASSAARRHIEEHAVVDGSIVWANSWISQEAHRARLDPRPQLPYRPQRRVEHGVVLGDKSVDHDLQHGYEPAASGSVHRSSIFKAYDVRGLYPAEIDEDAARAIGRGFVAYLSAKRIAVGRDMRLSSPSLAGGVHRGRARAGRRRRRLRDDARPTCCTSPSRATASTAARRSPPRTTRSSTTA